MNWALLIGLLILGAIIGYRFWMAHIGKQDKWFPWSK